MLSYLVGGECAIGGKGNLEGTDAGDWGNNGANQHSGGSIRNIIRFLGGIHKILFLSDPGVPGVRSMGPVVSHKLSYLVQTKLM